MSVVARAAGLTWARRQVTLSARDREDLYMGWTGVRLVWLDALTLVSVDVAEWGVEELWRGLLRRAWPATSVYDLVVLGWFLRTSGYGEICVAVLHWALSD